MQVFDVMVSEFVNHMGWKPSGKPPEEVYISQIDASGWAYNAGLIVGDQLMQINGTTISELTPDEFDQALKKRPLKLKFVRTGKPPPSKEKDKGAASKKQISITIVSAKGLRHADWIG